VLQQAGMATMLFDLLTGEEDAIDSRTAELRFNIVLLSKRLTRATDWLLGSSEIRNVKLGYFGASTGAAAALVAASERPDVGAVVSRGGRPDLAGPALNRVKAPTLLIVGESDQQVLELNRGALAQLNCEKRLEVVPGRPIYLRSREPWKMRHGARGSGLSSTWGCATATSGPRRLEPAEIYQFLSRRIPNFTA
jgi:dienelactone hydrolase